MELLKIEGAAGESEIVQNGTFKMLDNYIKGRKCCIITDKNVHRFYESQFPECKDIIVVDAGEVSKTFDVVKNIHRHLIDLELDRSSLIIGIGGGVITDLAGFVASTFLRGISFGFVATTVLSQVDAAIGGKNGVNLDGYKNIVGIIRQPEFVLIATQTLKTLPKKELINGMAEVIKSGLIANKELFEKLAIAAKTDAPFENFNMGLALGLAAKVKVDVVNRDVFEKGERRHLNLGHTLGHAIEKKRNIPHGFGVSIGICAAAHMSYKQGLISQDKLQLIINTLKGFGLPITTDVKIIDAMDAILKDKKRKSDFINFILLKDIGQAMIKQYGFKELETALENALKSTVEVC